jgi:FixJ family two-component response regulator
MKNTTQEPTSAKAMKPVAPTIYVVDDDDSMRQAITLLLQSVGYHPVPFDFLTKPFRDQYLLDRMNGALKQDAENRAVVERHADLRARAESLTAREREVFEFIVEGKANKVVAIDLGQNERTVEIHRSNVMEKMGARSVAHLVRMHLTLHGDKAPL